MLNLIIRSKDKIAKINSFLNSPFFALILTFFDIFCYYLGLDLLIIFIISISITLTFALNKNPYCILTIFLYMASMVSVKNSPANLENDENKTFFLNPSVYIPCIIAASIPIIVSIIRLIYNFSKKKIRFDLAFFSVCFLAFSFVINGLLIKPYNGLNLMFGCFMAFFFFALYFSILPSLTIRKEEMIQLSRQVAIYSLVPIIELLVYYIAFFASGNSITTRMDIFLGWGNRNTIGMLFVVCLPFIFCLYLNEQKRVFKILNLILMLILFLFTFMTFSRQSCIFMLLGICLCIGSVLLKHHNLSKKKNIFFFCGLLFSVLLISISVYVLGYFDLDVDSLFKDGRIQLWSLAIQSFSEQPIFGSGFFFICGDPVVQLQNVMPYCCHNTLLEMLGACGIVGFVGYILYRIMTTLGIIKNFSQYKVYPAISCLLFVFMSLVDIHIFDLLGTAIYIALFAILNASSSFESEKYIEVL